MSRFGMIRLQFAVLASLAVTIALGFGHAAERRWEQAALQESVQKCQVLERERNSAVQELALYRTRVRELQRQTGALEEILYNRARTYLFVCGSAAVAEKNGVLLSRAGCLPPGEIPAGVTMPVMGPSGFTAADFENAWQTCGARRLQGLGEVLVEAEREYDINALVLAAIVVHESSWGRSAIARDKNNLAGLGALDGSPYASALTFATRDESVHFLAELLARKYIVPEGQHYHGPDLAGIGIRYASDPGWARKVAEIMHLLARTMVGNPEALLDFALREMASN